MHEVLDDQEGMVTSPTYTDLEVVVVGGGISGDYNLHLFGWNQQLTAFYLGMCMAIKLLEAGVKKLVIIEKSSGFGGTWRDNRYPGCRCDSMSNPARVQARYANVRLRTKVPAHLYCFSFAGNPDWSRVFPDQIEIMVSTYQVMRLILSINVTRLTSQKLPPNMSSTVVSGLALP